MQPSASLLGVIAVLWVATTKTTLTEAENGGIDQPPGRVEPEVRRLPETAAEREAIVSASPEVNASVSRLENDTDDPTTNRSVDADERPHDERNASTVVPSTILRPQEDEVDAASVSGISERMSVEDIKAISFRVPPVSENEVVATRGDAGAPLPHRRKAFYEIKPSVNTEAERTSLLRDQSTTTAGSVTFTFAERRRPPAPPTTSVLAVAPQTRRSPARFSLPSGASGKYGPYFEDGEETTNVTARIGSTVMLDCRVGMLGDKEVTWLQHLKDSFRLLTVGRIPYSLDERIHLSFRYPSNWRLQIESASRRDSGLYVCQVSTHPPLVKKINVILTAPILTIVDDAGRRVAGERHLKAGSALKLRCEAWDVREDENEVVVWTRGDETLSANISENKTTEVLAGREIHVVVSTIFVEKATPRHAGNYSCTVPERAKTTVAVHVLNGELPAAVHDGSGVSRAVLNLWLIHLTVSYVFSR